MNPALELGMKLGRALHRKAARLVLAALVVTAGRGGA